MHKIKNENRASKILKFGLSFWILIFGFWVPSYAQDYIVAIVNNDIITQKDLDDFINFMRIQLSQEFKGRVLENKIQSMKLDLLDRLIEDQLILQEAKKVLEEAKKNKDLIMLSKLDIDQNMIKSRLEEIRKRYGSDIEFQGALAKQGLVQADIETKIKEQLLMHNIIEIKVRDKIIVKPDEVTDFYYKNPQHFKTSQRREFESMVIKGEDLANKIVDDLKNGQDLNELAKKYSLVVNSFSAERGKELRKDIEEAVFSLKLGEASRPIKSQGGVYIFKLNNIILPRQQNLPEVQNGIYSFLFDQKTQEGLSNWLDELKKHAYIKIPQD